PGTYFVKATVPATDNYAGLESIVSFEIRSGQNFWTATLRCPDIVYGQTPAPTASAAHGTVVYDYSVSEDGPFVPSAPENVGTYFVRATVEAENYEPLTAVRSFMIRKAVYDMSGVSFNDASFTYDGTVRSLEITGTLPEGVTVRYVGNGQSSPGTHIVTAKFSGDRDNYEPIPDMEARLVITPGENRWTTELTCADVPFGSQPQPNAAAEHGTPVYTYSTEEDGEYTATVPTQIGRYYVRAEVPAGDDYQVLSAVVPFRIQFTDVTDPAASNYDPVYWAVAEGITNGWADGTFRPWNTCNRASVVTFLWRLAGRPEPAGSFTFSDPTGNPEFDKAITWAVERGITTGWASDNTFRPWNTCNRATIVTFLWRYLGKPSAPAGYSATFADPTGNPDFEAAISWAAGYGITTGYSDNTFRPWNTCNRSQVVIFLYRMEHLAG
ncbi:MAG: S-layer homology domain-containing protein, partial [Lachnospiraceae bacterium]|nr:S-layer homology domain-containing protein [Lachnospiraceae bacterium]